ncbi:DUF4192 family protein [Streptomyces sp. NPDC047043]|uniref:DUF4192 family protein n=1 Tax=Streptomyces sp. NPDC047043 TaxID=3154497 RepID=UPI0033F3FE44
MASRTGASATRPLLGTGRGPAGRAAALGRPRPPLRAALLTLLAWATWREDDTAAARLVLCEAMTTIDSDYTLAQHLHQGLNQDVPVARSLEVFRTTAAQDHADYGAALRTL